MQDDFLFLGGKDNEKINVDALRIDDPLRLQLELRFRRK